MTERIGNVPSPAEYSSEDVKMRKLAQEIRKHLNDFVEDVQKAVTNPSLIDHEEFLQHFAQTILQLSAPSKQAAELNRER